MVIRPIGESVVLGAFDSAIHGVTVTRFLQLGKTDEEGTDPQGGCGVLGYKAASTGAPVVASGTNTITLECANAIGTGP